MASLPEGIWDGGLPAVGPSPPVVALYEYWATLRGARPLPARRDVDVLALRPWLGWLIIYDVLRDDAGEVVDFRYRLVGTGVTRLAALDLTGSLVSERAYTDDPGSAQSNLRAVTSKALPRYRTDRQIMASGKAMSGERLFLPLADNERDVNHIMCFVSPEDQTSIDPAGGGTWKPRSLF